MVKGAILGRENGEFLIDHHITRSKAVTSWFPLTNKIKRLPFYDRLAVEPSPTDPKALYVLGATWVVKKVCELSFISGTSLILGSLFILGSFC